MYLEHYQLKSKPFQITVDPRFLWLGEKHKEALATLRYGIIDNRGFLLLTGEVGTGKTILINRLVSLLDIDTVVATLTDPDLESMDFYNLLADGLGMQRRFDSKGAFLLNFRDFLYQSHRKDKQVLLIIDECQRLNPRLIEDIRVLSNIELHDRKLINIFFVGQQEFNRILMTSQNRALAQRITVRFHIEPLDEGETKSYILHRLKVAGTSRTIFDTDAIKAIHKFSGGLPRLINIISDHALLTGYSQNLSTINGKLINECTEDLRIPVKGKTRSGRLNSKQTVAINTANLNDQEQSSDDSFDDNRRPYSSANEETFRSDDNTEHEKSFSWKFAYAAMVLVLVGIVGFAITHFGDKDRPIWDTEDLTPQKYKTSLEKKKEALSSQITVAEASENNTDVDQQPQSDQYAQIATQNNDLVDIQDGAEERRVDSVLSHNIIVDQEETIEDKNRELEPIEPLPLLNEDMTVNFDSNSNEIENQSFILLDKIAQYLDGHPDVYIYVRGYTDSSGSDSYNKNVSLFRANNVKAYLTGKGVDSDRIHVFAMGARNPIASNVNVDGRRKNRRVEIEFSE
jgi:general secretion pathway protein A